MWADRGVLPAISPFAERNARVSRRGHIISRSLSMAESRPAEAKTWLRHDFRDWPNFSLLYRHGTARAAGADYQAAARAQR